MNNLDLPHLLELNIMTRILTQTNQKVFQGV